MRASMGMAAVILCGCATAANADVIITEVMSRSGTTGDWFEITNFGGGAVDLTGWGYDDETANPMGADLLEGVTSIGAGESIVVLRVVGDAAAEVAAFREFWGNIDHIQIATVSNAAGLGQGDGVTIFDAGHSLVDAMFYGDGITTDPDDLIADTHAGVWSGGLKWDSANFVQEATFVAGQGFDGAYGIRSSAFINGWGSFEFGSPGSAIPAPGALAVLATAGLVGARRKRA